MFIHLSGAGNSCREYTRPACSYIYMWLELLKANTPDLGVHAPTWGCYFSQRVLQACVFIHLHGAGTSHSEYTRPGCSYTYMGLVLLAASTPGLRVHTFTLGWYFSQRVHQAWVFIHLRGAGTSRSEYTKPGCLPPDSDFSQRLKRMCVVVVPQPSVT